MSASRSHDVQMTSGPLLKNVLAFAVPLILSGVLQLLYNSADIIVVGRFADSLAMAAVGSTTSLIHLMVSLLMGLSVGSSVAVARACGAKDDVSIHRAVHTSIALALISGFALGAAILAFSRGLLELMGCPENVIEGAALYLKIYAAGLPASMIYNFGAAILRAVGDTRRPLYFLTVSGIVNIILNILLVAGLKLSVAGVAIATVASEVLSCVLVLLCLIHSHDAIRYEPKKTRIYKKSLSMILRIGLPAGLQSSMFSISNVLIQSAINSFGAAAIAGNTAAASIEGFATTLSNALSQAALTFSSQNMGAGKYARVRRVLVVCLAATLIGGLCMGLLIDTFGTPLLALFNTDPDVISCGLIRVSHNMPPYFLFCLQDTFVGLLRGIGYSLLPTVTSLSGICLLRIVWLYTAFAASPTLDTLYLSYPVSWAATLAALIACYAVVIRKLPKGDA